MELFEDALRPPILLEPEPEAAQLELRLEPQALVLGPHQRLQGGAVEALQALNPVRFLIGADMRVCGEVCPSPQQGQSQAC